MDDSRYTLHRRAFFTLNALSPEERAAFTAKVNQLADSPIEQWPMMGARRLASDEPLYLVRVDDSLRAFVRLSSDGPFEVESIFRRETLRAFAPQQS